MALNHLGLLITISGEWDRGLALEQRAMALNPHFHSAAHLLHSLA
jgi:hypothetical protein